MGVAEEAEEGLLDGPAGQGQAGQQLVEGGVELVESGDEGQQFGEGLEVVGDLLEREGERLGEVGAVVQQLALRADHSALRALRLQTDEGVALVGVLAAAALLELQQRTSQHTI